MDIDCKSLASLAAARLMEQLTADSCDTKRAKDLSGILKDMAALEKELGGRESREVSVSFSEDAEEAAR